MLEKIELEEIVNIAQEAGDAIMQIYKNTPVLDVVYAPVMEWDIAADSIIRESGKITYQYHVNKPVIYNKRNLLNPCFVVRSIIL